MLYRREPIASEQEARASVTFILVLTLHDIGLVLGRIQDALSSH